MNFPANPTLDQTYTYGTRTWKWDGTTWNLQRGATALATVATTGSFTDLVNKPTTIAGYGITDATAAIPKITSIVVTDSSYNNLDDTAVSTAGGYIKILGTGFTTGSQVLINTTSASSVSFVNSTELRAQLPATSAGTYVVYVVAADGSVAIRVNGITFSATPTWTTSSTLPESLANNAISIQLAATSNSTVSYSLASGSTLPTGLSLSSSGVLSGTITGVTVATTYNFTINAIDQELQDSPRAFSISISVVVQIARSLRFNNADSAYLNRTPGSAGNRRTWTWSGWVKRGLIDLNYRSFFANGTSVDSIMFWNDTSLAVRNYNGSSYDVRTTQLFRDPSAWYHLVVAMNTTQSTASDRIKIYVNGVQVTTFAVATYPSQNYDTGFNTTTAQYLGYNEYNYFDGYMTEVNFVDGQALTPASFGEADPDTGVWRPKYYTGTYGTNGFYLNFSDNSATTATTLGKDYSGNSNNWTPNNFSVSAGAGNDSLVDSPTSYGTDTGVGGEVRGNYCTWNPLDTNTSTVFLTNGNLQSQTSSNSWANSRGTFAPTTGKWYFESTLTNAADYSEIGVIAMGRAIPASYPGGESYAWIYGNNGYLYNSGGITGFPGSGLSNGDVMMIAYDNDAGKVWFGRNGTWYNSGNPAAGTNASFPTYTIMQPIIGMWGSTAIVNTNFGQRPFAYTAPSGFKTLCSQNLPTPAIGATSTTQANKYFNAVTYTGNGSTQSVTGVEFQPDLVWTKSRSASGFNILRDSIRGSGVRLISDASYSELDDATYGTFTSDGFNLGSNTNINTSGTTYVAWNWKAGNSTVTNTAGSLTSQVRANTTAGFSIVSYSAGATNATVGHGLGVAPAMIIVKCRTNASAPWVIYHKLLSNQKDYTLVFGTDAQINIGNYWGTSGPNSTTFGTSYNGYANNIENLIAYCWAEIEGYSRFGSYVGNGSADGPFVYCGFRPRWVMIKAISSTSDWWITDTARNPNNVTNYGLRANTSGYEVTDVGQDILSNGFKYRNDIGAPNTNGVTYIFAAFAETPFKYARAR